MLSTNDHKKFYIIVSLMLLVAIIFVVMLKNAQERYAILQKIINDMTITPRKVNTPTF